MFQDNTNIRSFLTRHIGSSWQAESLKGDSGERYYKRIISPKGRFVFVHYPKSTAGFDDFIKIQTLLRRKNFHVPKIIYADKKNGRMLLEDIGSLSLEKYYAQKKDLFYYKQSIDQLILFQTLVKKKDLKKTFTSDQGFNEMFFTYQQYNLPVKNKNKLFKEFQEISSKFCSQPFTACHLDFHSRNLFIHNKKICLIDFQDAGQAPLYYDLVSLVEDAYVPLSQTEKNELIQYYISKTDGKFNSGHFEIIFFQRAFKAIGRFLHFYNEREQKTHLKYIRPFLKGLYARLTKINQYPCFLDYVKICLNRRELV